MAGQPGQNAHVPHLCLTYENRKDLLLPGDLDIEVFGMGACLCQQGLNSAAPGRSRQKILEGFLEIADIQSTWEDGGGKRLTSAAALAWVGSPARRRTSSSAFAKDRRPYLSHCRGAAYSRGKSLPLSQSFLEMPSRGPAEERLLVDFRGSQVVNQDYPP